MATRKATKKIQQRIFCDKISEGHIIEDACKMADISKQTFYNWKESDFDFLDAYERAEVMRMDRIKERAISGLSKLVDTYEFTEVHIEQVPGKADPKAKEGEQPKPVIKSQRTVKRVIMPNEKAIEFALTNLDAKKFKNRSHVDHTNNGEAFSFANFLMGANTVPDDGEEVPAGDDAIENQENV